MDDSTADGYKTDACEHLTPRYAIPMGLIGVGLFVMWFSLWLGGAIALLGAFLAFQTATLRLRFTATAMDLYRGAKRIRQFPYQDWNHWEIFWGGIPLLFYFREVNSIHFLPILFNTEELRHCLQRYCRDTAPHS